MTAARRSGRAAALVVSAGLLYLLGASGCAIVNPQSAVRLASQAQLTTRSLIQALEDTRTGLSIYVEGKALSGPLLNQEPLPKETLCSIASAQRSLRLRVQLLGKLSILYDHFADLATQGRDDPGIFDNTIGELDPADYPADPLLVADCPGEGEVARPPPDPAAGPVASATSPSPWLGVSRSRSLRYASMRIRQVLGRLIELLDKELPLYASLQREALRSRKGLAKALLTKYGTVSPGDLLAPQLQELGLRWDELQFQRQQQDWPPAKRAAVQAALAAAVERRAELLLGTQSTALAQHLSLLRALARLHLSLEVGQPLDWRQVAAPVLPVVRSINLRDSCKNQ
jgi:hypothetical protein